MEAKAFADLENDGEMTGEAKLTGFGAIACAYLGRSVQGTDETV